ncbi:hypothetical protein H9P43_003796 [Blastocladiella emersonii ATCC 22665]|nr:hypothetical protein H9P43_003796 [Blastocladiella emersonii ATCC 22665]
MYPRRINWLLAAACILLAVLTPAVRADERSHRYTAGEEVVVWASTVGPFANSAETYDFFSLPYCNGPATAAPKHDTLGEALLGLAPVNLGVPARFGASSAPNSLLCTASLDPNRVAAFTRAVREAYRFQLVVDDLPVWGWVGRTSGEHHDSSSSSSGSAPRAPAAAPASNASLATGAVPTTNTSGARDATTPSQPRAYLYTHFDFRISTNNDRIIHVNLTTTNPRLLDPLPLVDAAAPALAVNFTYTVAFSTTTVPFSQRFEKYLDAGFFEHRVHWFSLANSLLLLAFLVALVVAILVRSLRRDFARYDVDIFDMDRDLLDGYDAGWRQVHADVFRAPPRTDLLAACLGSGAQLATLAIATIAYSAADAAYKEIADGVTAAVFIYAVTSGVNGAVSAAYCARYGGGSGSGGGSGARRQWWVRQALLSAALVPAASCAVFFAVNLVAIATHSARAIPFTSMVSLAAIFVFLVVPLTVIGAAVGRHYFGGARVSLSMLGASSTTLAGMAGAAMAGFPCRVSPIPRPIPDRTWHTHPWVLVLAGGVLPFASIFIEQYFLLTAVFGYRAGGAAYYYIYGWLALALVLVLASCACCSTVVAYVLLNAEDHRWHWASFCASASTAAYMFVYAAYYYAFKSQMHGLFQTVFYFGYTLAACGCMAVLLGTVGHLAATAFVLKLYRNVKLD